MGGRPVLRLTQAGWTPLPHVERTGTPDSTEVKTLGSFNGSLLGAGEFTRAGGVSSAYVARWTRICPVGDTDCSGDVGVGDISSFVLALTNPIAFVGAETGCDLLQADTDGDGIVSVDDIGPMVAILTGG